MAAGDHWTVLQGGQYEKPGRVCGTKNVSTCWQFANTAGAGSEHSSTGDGQDGTATHPIVIEGEDNGTVIKSVITGCTVVYADYLWFKNLDFDGSCDISDAINFNSASRGAKVINNYIHDTSEDNLDHHCPASGDPTNPANDSGISDFSGGGDTYLYGNMEWNTRYGLYQHNDSKANPIDYVIKNIVFNIKEKWQDNSTHTACVHGESQNLQQYSQSGATFHQYDYKNVLFDSESTQGFRDSGILGGGTTTPNIDLVFTENYTYNIPLWQFGDSTPIQLTYTNNYIGNGGANFFRWEGSGETCAASLPYPTDGQIITGNTLVPDTVFSAKTVQITTQIWNPGGVPVCSTRLNGTQPFRSVDIISNNTYLGTGLTYDIFCNNSNLTNQTFANYKSAGIACGLASFETGTTTGAHPSTPKIFLNLNDYDSTQATLVVYNWAGTANVTIPHALLDTFLVNCEGFDAYDVEDIFGGTVYSTTYNGADVSFPVGATNEFKTYLLKKVS